MGNQNQTKSLRNAGEDCSNCAWVSCSSYGVSGRGCPSYDRGPSAPEPASMIPAQWMSRLEYAFAETRDGISTMQISEIVDPDLDGAVCGDWRDWQFVAWGEKYVYFPRESCGYYHVGYVSRNPCDVPKLD